MLVKGIQGQLQPGGKKLQIAYWIEGWIVQYVKNSQDSTVKQTIQLENVKIKTKQNKNHRDGLPKRLFR